MYINVVALFLSWDEAKRAEPKLRAYGCVTNVLAGNVDPYSNATWLDVFQPTDLTDENDPRFFRERGSLEFFIETLGGMPDESGLVEKYEFRDASYEHERDPVTHKYVFREVSRYPYH
jgi:hypothetical protein